VHARQNKTGHAASDSAVNADGHEPTGAYLAPSSGGLKVLRMKSYGSVGTETR